MAKQPCHAITARRESPTILFAHAEDGLGPQAASMEVQGAMGQPHGSAVSAARRAPRHLICTLQPFTTSSMFSSSYISPAPPNGLQLRLEVTSLELPCRCDQTIERDGRGPSPRDAAANHHAAKYERRRLAVNITDQLSISRMHGGLFYF